MASKTLIRSGDSLMTRFMHPVLYQSPTQKIVPQIFDIQPKLFTPPSFSSILKLQNLVNLIQNDAETLKKVCSEGFLYPCGLPSLRFFLPAGKHLFFYLIFTHKYVGR
ncbi:putative ribosomal protein L34 [Helianthus debilis subsp. tardiflorus]